MQSRESHSRFDALLAEYAIEHLDWPETEEELDRLLINGAEGGIASGQPELPLLFDLGSSDSGVKNPRLGSETLRDVVRQAYLNVYSGCSIDRLIADPCQNARFIQACWKLGAQASQYDLNHILLNARKDKIIGKVEGVQRYSVPRGQMDQYLFASEFALRLLQDQEYFENHRFVSLDRILCDPALAQRFEGLAKAIMPGFSSLDYRWAAFSIRKAQNRRMTADLAIPEFERLGQRDALRTSRIARTAGFFWLNFEKADLYIGHAENLREQVERLADLRWGAMAEVTSLFGMGDLRKAEFAVAPYSCVSPSNREPLKAQLVQSIEPKLNVLKRGLQVA